MDKTFDNLKNIEEASTWSQRDRISDQLRFLKYISPERSKKFQEVNTLELSKVEASDLIARLEIEMRKAKKEQLLNKLNK
jgi:hypothetical protein